MPIGVCIPEHPNPLYARIAHIIPNVCDSCFCRQKCFVSRETLICGFWAIVSRETMKFAKNPFIFIFSVIY